MESYSVQATLSAVDKNLSSTFGKATQAASDFESKSKQSLENVGKFMAVAGAAVTAIGIKSVNSFGDFQSSLNKAAIIAGGTSKDIQGLADVANHMGAVLPISAQDAADAMVAMARDGASLGTIKKEFPAIAEAATAAGADLQSTASVVQQAMNIWGDSLESPQQAAAILTETANLSNASIEDMQQALATIGGTASNAGISMTDTSEAIGLLTNKGFSAAQASLDLNHALLMMQAPSDKAAGAAQDLGLSFNDANGNMKPLPQILNEISDSMAGMTSSQKAAALKAMFGTSGMAAILPLMGSIKDKTDNTTTSWDAYSAAMQAASKDTGTATSFLNDQASEMQKNLGSKIEQVGGNWEALRNAAMAGSAGVISSIVDMMSSTLEWATTSNSAIGSGIRTFLGLSPIIGAATLATGSFLTAATRIGSTMSTVGTALKSLFLSPLGLVIVAIAALVAALTYAYKTSETFRNAISEIGKSLKSGLAPAFDFVKKTISSFTGDSVNLFKQFSNMVANVFVNLASSINFKALSNTIITGIKTIISVASALAPVFLFITNTILSFVTTAINGFINLANEITNSFSKSVKSFDFSVLLNTITVVFGAMMDIVIAFGNIVSSVIDSISNTNSVGVGWGSVNNVLKGVQTVAVFLSTAVTDLINSFISTGAIQSAWNAVVSVIKAMISIVKAAVSIASELFNKFQSINSSQSIFENIGIAIGKIVKVIATVITAVANFISAMMKIQAVRDIIQSVIVTAAALFVAFKAYSVLIAIINGIKTAITAARAAMVIFNLVMAANPIGLLITAIVALVAGLVYFFSMTKTGQAIWAGFVAFLKSSLANLVSIFQDIGNSFVIAWQTAVLIGENLWMEASDFISNIWIGLTQLFSSIWGSITSVMATIVSGVQTAWANLSAALSVFWQANVILFTTIWNVLVTVITTIVNAIVAVWNGFTGIISSIWNGILGVATAIWNVILKTITTIVTTTVNIVSSIWNRLIAIASGIWNAVSSVVSSVWNTIVSIVSSMASNAVHTLQSIWSAIAGVVSSIWNSAKGIISSIWSAIVSVVSSMASNAFNSLRGAWSGVSGFVSGLWNSARSAISGAWSGIVSTIRSMASNAFGSLRSAWGGVVGWVSGIWNSVKGAIMGAMNFSLFGAGSAIMNGFLNGLRSVWGSITSFVGGIASWIRRHKGPIQYDRKLLIPAGNAIMNGLNAGLVDNFKTVQKNVSGMAGSILDAATSVGNLATNAIGDPINALNNNIGGSYSSVMTLDHTSKTQPANITIGFDKHGYTAYVDDINNQQGKTALLKRNNSVQL